MYYKCVCMCAYNIIGIYYGGLLASAMQDRVQMRAVTNDVMLLAESIS